MTQPQQSWNCSSPGFAYDGYMIYYSKSGVYKSSWGLVESRPESPNCVYNTPADALTPEQVNFPDNGEPGTDTPLLSPTECALAFASSSNT